jgi:hypothetical protein
MTAPLKDPATIGARFNRVSRRYNVAALQGRRSASGRPMGCRPTSFDDHPDVGSRRRWFCEKARSSAYHQNYEIGVATKTWLIAMFKFKSSHHRPRFVEAGASFREKTLRSCLKSWLIFGVITP